MRRILIIFSIFIFATLAFALPTPPKTTLCATMPTQDIGNTPLTRLDGWKVYWSRTSGQYTDAQSVSMPLTISAAGTEVCKELVSVIGGPLEGWYFVATDWFVNTDSTVAESAFSNEVSATSPGSPGGCRLL